MNKTADIRAELTRNSIQEAFLQLLSVKKYKDISILEIMEKAGYNRGTFYEYFKDKQDLFESIEDEHITGEKITHHLIHVIRTKDKNEIHKELIDFLKENDRYLAIVFKSGELSRFYEVYLDHVIPVVLESIAKKTEAQGIPFDEAYYGLYIKAITSAFITMLIQWYEDGKPCSIEELMRIADEFIRGVPLQTQK